ncbi:MAG: hypothetical protein Q7S40_22695 [Opitutaceae bacterium]|nr:hypothetical protein [Opitutaceae bacterium]
MAVSCSTEPRTVVMQKEVEQAMRLRRGQIRSRWLELLFVEPVNTPLANPRALIFMLDETLDAIFAALRCGSAEQPASAPDCPCGRNPYLSYFRAGRQALFEALVLLQAEAPTLDPVARDAAVTALDLALRQIATDAIEGFGSLCRHRATGFTPCDHPECDRIDGVDQPQGDADERMD